MIDLKIASLNINSINSPCLFFLTTKKTNLFSSLYILESLKIFLFSLSLAQTLPYFL